MPVHFIKQKKFLPGVRNNSEREKRGAANSYVIIILVYIFGSYSFFYVIIRWMGMPRLASLLHVYRKIFLHVIKHFTKRCLPKATKFFLQANLNITWPFPSSREKICSDCFLAKEILNVLICMVTICSRLRRC